MNLTFREKAEQLFLTRLNDALDLTGIERFTRMSEAFLNNYLLNEKEEIYKLFGNNFYVIEEITGSAHTINEADLFAWLQERPLHRYGDEVADAFVKFTKKVLADSAKCDVLANKIKRDFEIDGVTFKENQKLSKAFIKYVSSFAGDERREVQNILGDSYDAYKAFLEEWNYINVKYYLRLSIDPIDFFYMGHTRTQQSCTRINWNREAFSGDNYAKAIFTYLQTETFIATLHFTEESAKRGKEGDYRRIYSFDLKEKFLIGHRPYGSSKKINIFLANSVERFLKERLSTDFLLSSSIQNIGRKTGKKDDRIVELHISRDNISDNLRFSDSVGYIDALHYCYNRNYTIASWNEKHALQTSLFNDQIEENTYMSLKDMKWGNKNPYYKFLVEVKGKLESMYGERELYGMFFGDCLLQDSYLDRAFIEDAIQRQVNYVEHLKNVPQMMEEEQELE